MIWEYGSAEVARHPLTGIGYAAWQHPSWISDSVDNFWLLLAMRHGLPCVALLFAGLFVIIAGLGSRSGLSPAMDRYRKAWIISMMGVLIAGATVAFWNQTLAFFFFLLGSGVWMLDSKGATRSRACRTALAARRVN